MYQWLPAHRSFAYLTWPAIEAMPHKDQVVILQPMGAIEQHGPHLPLIVDVAIATAVIGRALATLDPQIPAFVLPPLSYGKSNEHWHFPGTITLSSRTLSDTLTEVAESIYRAGFRKLVWVNGHGGQPQILELVSRDLHQQYPDFWLFPHFVWNVPHCAADLLTPKELGEGLHAGDAETSLLLALLPDQVKMDHAVAEYPPAPPDKNPHGLLSPEGALPFSWVTRDLSRSGVIGDPLPASAAKGEQLWQSLAAGWQRAIADIYHFQPPRPPD